MSNNIAVKDKKVLIVGLDGTTWDLLKPWAARGLLPTLKKLMENGVYGNLESTIPPVTVPAWVSFATGKNAGKHGCHYFAMPRGSLGELRPITTKEIRGRTFYEMLDGNGKKCILINLPASYPPRIKETVITSLLTQGDNFIFPPGLVDEIPELKSYRITPDYSLLLKGKIDDFINDVRKLEKNRFECAKKLFTKDWDLFFLLFSGTDMIQHQIYDKLIDGKMDEDSEAVKLYKEIDQYIGWFVDNIPQDTHILLMSDHGFGAYKKSFHINGWLRKEGYLVVEPKTKRSIPQQRAEEEEKKARAERRNVKLPIFLLNHQESLRWLSPLYRILKRMLKLEMRLDVLQARMSQTSVYSPYFCAIYINDKKRFIDGKIDVKEYEKVKTELVDKLKQIKNPQTGQNIINNIWRKEDIYTGSELDIAPDIVFLPNEYEYVINSSSFSNKPLIINRVSVTHSLYGILLAYGPDIKKGVEIQGAKIYDIAPTLLHIIGIPVPKDMDGRVLKEIFKEGSEPAKRKVVYQEVEGGKEKISKKVKELKSLGRI